MKVGDLNLIEEYGFSIGGRTEGGRTSRKGGKWLAHNIGLKPSMGNLFH